jgi:hypothetical protein
LRFSNEAGTKPRKGRQRLASAAGSSSDLRSYHSSYEMSEPTTGTVEPTKVAEAQPEVVQKDGPVPTTTVKAAEDSGNDSAIVEPQNDLTKNFTDAEWKGMKELRVSNVTLTEKARLMSSYLGATTRNR